MEYYSTKTKKLYKEVAELEAAEKDFDEKQAAGLKKRDERAARAKQVEDAYKKYVELLDAFIQDYGYYVDYKKTSSNELSKLLEAFFVNWPF